MSSFGCNDHREQAHPLSIGIDLRTTFTGVAWGAVEQEPVGFDRTSLWRAMTLSTGTATTFSPIRPPIDRSHLRADSLFEFSKHVRELGYKAEPFHTGSNYYCTHCQVWNDKFVQPLDRFGTLPPIAEDRPAHGLDIQNLITNPSVSMIPLCNPPSLPELRANIRCSGWRWPVPPRTHVPFNTGSHRQSSERPHSIFLSRNRLLEYHGTTHEDWL
jgi:hypothetical protein